jgi:hypothetical protein
MVRTLLRWLALIPQPLLAKREKGSQIQSPSPALGEGFRVRVMLTIQCGFPALSQKLSGVLKKLNTKKYLMLSTKMLSYSVSLLNEVWPNGFEQR